MKIINLSVVTQVVNKEGEELLEKASTESNKPKTYGGKPLEWWEDMGLPIPELDEEFDDIERDENGLVILDDKHLDYEGTSCAIPIKNIDSWMEHEDIGTMLYMKSGMFYHIFEEVDEITDYIQYLETPQYKKWWIELKILYKKLTNKNN